ncbi:hypothetical protein CCP2SC5_30006 [Azospirillaceae bacterium]
MRAKRRGFVRVARSRTIAQKVKKDDTNGDESLAGATGDDGFSSRREHFRGGMDAELKLRSRRAGARLHRRYSMGSTDSKKQGTLSSTPQRRDE